MRRRNGLFTKKSLRPKFTKVKIPIACRDPKYANVKSCCKCKRKECQNA